MDQELDPALAHADAVALAPDDVALRGGDEQITPAWGAVAAMMLGVTALLTAEFLPSGLLTPMARDLAVSPGLGVRLQRSAGGDDDLDHPHGAR